MPKIALFTGRIRRRVFRMFSNEFPYGFYSNELSNEFYPNEYGSHRRQVFRMFSNEFFLIELFNGYNSNRLYKNRQYTRTVKLNSRKSLSIID